jgi:hypothetical protein
MRQEMRPSGGRRAGETPRACPTPPSRAPACRPGPWPETRNRSRRRRRRRTPTDRLPRSARRCAHAGRPRALPRPGFAPAPRESGSRRRRTASARGHRPHAPAAPRRRAGRDVPPDSQGGRLGSARRRPPLFEEKPRDARPDGRPGTGSRPPPARRFLPPRPRDAADGRRGGDDHAASFHQPSHPVLGLPVVAPRTFSRRAAQRPIPTWTWPDDRGDAGPQPGLPPRGRARSSPDPPARQRAAPGTAPIRSPASGPASARKRRANAA